MKFTTLLLIAVFFSLFSIAQTTYPTGATGCIARWSFTDSLGKDTVLDVSGNKHNGKGIHLTPSTNFQGLSHTSMRFDGTSSYGLIPHDTTLNPQKITIIAVIQPLGFYKGTCQGNNIVYKGFDYYTQAGTWCMFIGDYDGNCAKYTPSIEVLDFAGPASPSYTLPSGNNIDSNKWYFLALTYNGDTLKRYQLVMDTTTFASSIVPISSSKLGYALGKNTYDVRIGSTQNPPYPYWFNGNMDEIAVFNRVLADTEIYSVYKYLHGKPVPDTAHAKDTCCCEIKMTDCIARWSFTDSLGKDTVLDVSGNKHNGKGFNLTSSSNFRGVSHTAMRFDGSTSYGLIPHDTALNPQKITIVAVVQSLGFYKGTCQGNNIVYKGYDYYTQAGTWSMFITDYDGDCAKYTPSTEVLDFAGPSTSSYTIPPGNNIDSNKWYFFALTYNGDSLKRYQLIMDTASYATSIAPISTSKLGTPLGKNTYDVRIGSTQNPPFPYWFNGNMDEIFVFNRALADTEIHCIYAKLWRKPDTAVSVNDIKHSHIQLFPNPNSGSFTIAGNVSGANSLLLDVLNETGQIVYSENIIATSGNINKRISINSPSGIYLVRLRSANESTVTRLIITR